MTHPVERELVKAVKFKGSKDDRQEFLRGLSTALRDLPDDDWDSLSEAAQEWSNKADSARADGKPIVDFVAKEEAAAATEEEENDVTTTTKKKLVAQPNGSAGAPKTKTTKKKVVTKKAKTTPAKKKKVVAKKKTGNGTQNFSTEVMKIFCKDPTISKAEMMNRLEKVGYKPSEYSVAAYMANFKKAARVFQDLGMLKKDIL